MMPDFGRRVNSFALAKIGLGNSAPHLGKVWCIFCFKSNRTRRVALSEFHCNLTETEERALTALAKATGLTEQAVVVLLIRRMALAFGLMVPEDEPESPENLAVDSGGPN